MPNTFFSKDKKKSDIDEQSIPQCLLQIPSTNDITLMKHMTAGASEDQSERQSHMAQQIIEFENQFPYLPILTTDQVILPEYWYQLFAAINKGKKEQALKLFAEIPSNDIILKSLNAVHTPEYIHELIINCIDSHKTGMKQVNNDIVVTPGTFEVLIRDIGTTLLYPTKIRFSFGLPSHHAFSQQGTGFCILNKTAIVIKHAELTHSEPLKYIIIGTDVNRDNGLCNILMQTASHLDICHIDIFDSRVYPNQDHHYINQELNHDGIDVGQNIMCWQKKSLNYYAVDLSETVRSKTKIHPALQFALDKIKENIKNAKINGQKIMLLLPTGWDSHENETAYCGKFINGQVVAQSATYKYRFNDGDLECFYEKLLDLYQENSDFIEGLYWGLEGGYDKTMYEHEIRLLLHIINKQFFSEYQSQFTPI